MPKKTETTPLFKVSLKVNDTELKGAGDTLPDALKTIQPRTWKSKGILTIESAGKKTVKLLYIAQMKRLFGINDTTRKILSKYLLQSLK